MFTRPQTHPALTRALAAFDDPGVRHRYFERKYDPHRTPDMIPDLWGQLRAERADRAERAMVDFLEQLPPRVRRANLRELLDHQHGDEARAWLESPKTRNLFLIGPPGVGKTWVGYALLIEAAAQMFGVPLPVMDGGEPMGMSVAALLDGLRPTTPPVRRLSPEVLWSCAKEAAVLLLDDLAHTRPTDWSVERLWTLADHRSNAHVKTIITANATWKDLEETWGAATMDRFNDGSVVIQMTGESMRAPAW